MLRQLHIAPHYCFNEAVLLEDLGPVNCVVGANNSGKSSLLASLRTIGTTWAHLERASWRLPVDARLVSTQLLNVPSGDLSGYMALDSSRLPTEAHYRPVMRDRRQNRALTPTQESVKAMLAALDVYNWHVVHVNGERLSQDALRVLLETQCKAYLTSLPRVTDTPFEIPGRRSLALQTTTSDYGSTYSQIGLSTALRAIQESDDEFVLHRLADGLSLFHPLFKTHQLRVRRHETHGQEVIVLRNNANGIKYPLDSFGDGLHQIVLLMAPLILKSVMPTDGRLQLVLLEEPETNLHPSLWRAILMYLSSEADRGNIQLFVTTHSRDVIATLSHGAIIWTKQQDAAAVGGCSAINATLLLRSLGLDIELTGRPCHQDLLAELLLGGRVLVVEGLTDQMVYQHIVRDMGFHDVRVVNVNGDGEVAHVVSRLRSAFGPRAFGLVDASKKNKIAMAPGVHIAERRGLERYLLDDGKGQKATRAIRALRGQGGASLDVPALRSEAIAALSL